MTSQEQTDKIIAYLRQELSRKEQAVFENEIAANPDLKQEVAEHRDALKVLDIHSETFLKNKLQGFREQRRWKRKRWRRFAMAASFGAVFLFVATFYTLQRNQYSDSTLA